MPEFPIAVYYNEHGIIYKYRVVTFKPETLPDLKFDVYCDINNADDYVEELPPESGNYKYTFPRPVQIINANGEKIADPFNDDYGGIELNKPIILMLPNPLSDEWILINHDGNVQYVTNEELSRLQETGDTIFIDLYKTSDLKYFTYPIYSKQLETNNSFTDALTSFAPIADLYGLYKDHDTCFIPTITEIPDEDLILFPPNLPPINIFDEYSPTTILFPEIAQDSIEISNAVGQIALPKICHSNLTMRQGDGDVSFQRMPEQVDGMLSLTLNAPDDTTIFSYPYFLKTDLLRCELSGFDDIILKIENNAQIDLDIERIKYREATSPRTTIYCKNCNTLSIQNRNCHFLSVHDCKHLIIDLNEHDFTGALHIDLNNVDILTIKYDSNDWNLMPIINITCSPDSTCEIETEMAYNLLNDILKRSDTYIF